MLQVKQSNHNGIDKDILISPKPSIGLKYGVMDEEGNILQEHEAECYTYQFMRQLYAMMAHDSNTNIVGMNVIDDPDTKQVGNIDRNYYLSSCFRIGNPPSDMQESWKMGIGVGTWEDTDASPLTSKTIYGMYKPYNRINNSTAGGGDLEYGNNDLSSNIVDDSADGKWTYTITRSFTNHDPSDDVIVKSMHLCMGLDDLDLIEFDDLLIMLARDILSSPETISAGATKTFYYQFTISTDDGTGTGEWTITRDFLVRLRQQIINDKGDDDENFWVGNQSSSTRGIVPSTDDASLAANPTDMQTPISHGVNTGQLIHYTSRILGLDSGEPNGFGFTENAFRIEGEPGSLDSTNNQLNDSTVDFTVVGVTTSDYVYDYTNDKYYSITAVSANTLDLGEDVPSDASITYCICNETAPQSEIVVREVFENQSGGSIIVNKVYLVDATDAIIGGKYLKEDTDNSVTIADDEIARFIMKIPLIPDN